MLLPDVTRRDEVKFYFAKSLPYNARLAISVLLIAIGLGMQVALPPEKLLLYFWFGLPALFVGVLMLLVKGYADKLPQNSGDEQWRPVEREQVQRIIDIQEKAKKWDEATIDITSNRGCFTFFGFCVVTAALTYAIGFFNGDLMLVVPIDMAVLFFPFFVTGTRSFLLHSELTIKTEIFLTLRDRFEKMKKEGEEFQFQLKTRKDKAGTGEAPEDIKAIVLFRNGPPEFLGVQMQVSINSVQGMSYPYFYCVLVAKKELDKLRKLNVSQIPPKVIYEPSLKDEVEIAVFRQYTTNKSGYHTDDDMIEKVFDFSIDAARKAVGSTN